ncbi:hypothetical protein [Streptomyces sp. 6N223]
MTGITGEEETTVSASGIRLCVQGFGRAGDPLVLLISGLASRPTPDGTW